MNEPPPQPGSIDDCLQTVSTTAEELHELLGSVTDGGDLYLVGSLAARLGTSRSDIDIHIFTDDEKSSDAPMMFFRDQTIVDLRFYPRRMPNRACEELADRWVTLPFGQCSLGATPAPAAQTRLSRWATSVPFADGAPALLSPAQRMSVARTLVRAALEKTVRFAALGELFDHAGMDSRAAWRRAGRGAVETAVRASGEIFAGSKWLWAIARRAGLDTSFLVSADTCRSVEDFHAVTRLARLDLGPADRLVRVSPSEYERFRLSGGDFLLIGKGQLCTAPPSHALEEAPLHMAVKNSRAQLVAELLGQRLLSIRVDTDALDKAIA